MFQKTEAGNKEWTIQRHWQHWIHKLQNGDKQRQKNNSENHNYEQHGRHPKTGVNLDSNIG